MAGSLIKIAEAEVTSSTASVTLTGIDSTYDVYIVTVRDHQGVNDTYSRLRVTESGTAKSTSTYDFAHKYLKSDTTFADNTSQNNNAYDFTSTVENDTSRGGANAVIWLYNFHVSGQHKFINSVEVHNQGGTTDIRGLQGAGEYYDPDSSTSVQDGINIFMNSGNIARGKYSLYGLKKS